MANFKKIQFILGLITIAMLIILIIYESSPLFLISQIIIILIWNQLIIDSVCNLIKKDGTKIKILNIVIRIVFIPKMLADGIQPVTFFFYDAIVTALTLIGALPVIIISWKRKKNDPKNINIKKKYKNTIKEIPLSEYRENGIINPEKFKMNLLDIYKEVIAVANSLSHDDLKVLCSEKLYNELTNKFQLAKEEFQEYNEKVLNIPEHYISSIYNNKSGTQVTIIAKIEIIIKTFQNGKKDSNIISEIKKLEFYRPIASDYNIFEQNCDNCGAPLDIGPKCTHCDTAIDPKTDPNHWILSDIKNIEE